MKHLLAILVLSILLAGCGKKQSTNNNLEEDLKAKSMLEGVWVDSDEGSVVFKVKGDSIYYPDSVSQAVKFSIISDTLIMYGNTTSKYKILRQEPHFFEFKTFNGDVIKIVKSDDPFDAALFTCHSTVTLNQQTTIKRDTVVTSGDKRYHCYVQVNPTTYKVLRTSINNEGLDVDHVYYDNTIHVSVFCGTSKVFSHDFSKADFASAIPQNMLRQCVLSDMLMSGNDQDGVRYTAQLAIPESPSSIVVEVLITYTGKYSVKINQSN